MIVKIDLPNALIKGWLQEREQYNQRDFSTTRYSIINVPVPYNYDAPADKAALMKLTKTELVNEIARLKKKTHYNFVEARLYND